MKRSMIMSRAWEIAREGKSRFGGKVKEYLKLALKQAWAEASAVVEVVVEAAETPDADGPIFDSHYHDYTLTFAMRESVDSYELSDKRLTPKKRRTRSGLLLDAFEVFALADYEIAIVHGGYVYSYHINKNDKLQLKRIDKDVRVSRKIIQDVFARWAAKGIRAY